VAAHGTVIARSVASHTGLFAPDLWRRRQCSAFVVLSLPALRLERIVDRVG
jgi:hypothetical protein